MQSTVAAEIEIWSDYVCPFCYLEKPVLDRLKKEWGPALRIHWHAFELRPDPLPTLDPHGDYLRHTWARSVYPLATQRGMNLHLPPVQPRSRRAFEAVEFARSYEKFEPMHWSLFRVFFEQGKDLNDIDVLVDVGASVGLDADELRAALQQNRFLWTVLADEENATDFGIESVPTMLIRRPSQPLEAAIAISGAHPYDMVASTVRGVQRS